MLSTPALLLAARPQLQLLTVGARPACTIDCGCCDRDVDGVVLAAGDVHAIVFDSGRLTVTRGGARIGLGERRVGLWHRWCADACARVWWAMACDPQSAFPWELNMTTDDCLQPAYQAK